MKTIVFALATLASAPVALAAPPAPPVVTVGADHVKRLQFDWPSVPGVGRYELWFRAAPGAEWVKYAETTPQHSNIRINVSVHLLDWRVARYRVAACNSSGCTYSAAVGVEDLALDAVGYLKPYYAGEGRWFGQAVAMSADGMTAAVVTADSAGLNADNGIVYVYRKIDSTAPWRLQTRLTPSLIRRSSSHTYAGTSLAVNGNGTLIAFGRFYEGIGGQSRNGAVYLFRRNDTTWSQEKRLAGGFENDRFGNAVDLDDSGNTLSIWRRGNSVNGQGVTEIYNRTSAGWQLTATLPVPPDELPPNEFGTTICAPHQALSGDGQTLVRTCNVPGMSPVVLVHNAPGWAESARIIAGTALEIDTNFDGTLFVARRASVADVYRLDQNVWIPDIGSPLEFNDVPDFGALESTSIALSRDGKFVAAGSVEDRHGTIGPNYPPIPDEASGARGSVYVFERKPSGWKLRRLMKPSVTTSTNYGLAVAIGAAGRNLIVGSVFDSSAATGINGDPTDTSAPGTGAAWLY